MYKSTKDCVLDLERNGQLIRVKQEMDPDLEMAEIQRRLYEVQGPAVLFEHVKGSSFPAVCNLYGTFERAEFIFRRTLEGIKRVVQLKADPTNFLRAPHKFLSAPFTAINALPMKSLFSKPILYGKTTLDQLPQIKSWPMDGGPFVTLPQVLTEDPDKPGPMKTNVGMYRVQMGGNEFIPNQEVGIHYQIHRGIGVHHTKAAERGEKLKVTIMVGGPPAHAFGAVMPLPEGLSELMFAGMFAGRRFRYTRKDGHFLSSDADFCIVGTIDPSATKPEGPFGDHLGYYSLTHEFPVMKVDAVYHRKDAIWPFTVVGRPPQEDTTFGHLIHEVTGPMVPASIPGLHAMQAVDAAGVHPLLVAIGSERYGPFQKTKMPQEILTIANAILGFNQASLAKYVIIAAANDNPKLDLHDMPYFLQHVLERIDLTRDLHFQTKTTMDTLDYSGTGINQGSKVVMAAAGEVKRSLSKELDENFRLPEGFSKPKFALPGVLMVQAPTFKHENARQEAERFVKYMEDVRGLEGIPMMVLVDDSEFAAAKLNNFLWVTFTRSNPSHDIYGIKSFTEFKHWGCHGPMVIDARIKPHHAPPLVEDPKVTKRVDELAKKGGIFEGLW